MKRDLRFWIFACVVLYFVTGCSPREEADLILKNGTIYTMDEGQPVAQALAIQGDRILVVGSESKVMTYAGSDTRVQDLGGQFVMPGFIEGHGHFHALGESLVRLNLNDTKSWEEVINRVADRVAETPAGQWIVGRGWHQEKWDSVPAGAVGGYPFHEKLSAISPDHPVMLHHASGHAIFANAAAMSLAGINPETRSPRGGVIVRDEAGHATGVFEENAERLITGVYERWRDLLPESAKLGDWHKAVGVAEQECLSKGITSFQDAGSSFEEVERYRSLAVSDALNLRLWVMLNESPERLEAGLKGFPVIGAGRDFLTCRAIKAYLDGALGSFGAWLLQPYRDKPGFTGQNVTQISELEEIASLAMSAGMQLCVHAIGDRANRELLDLYSRVFDANPEARDLRWRVEHAQHLDTTDIPRFRKLDVIASMQGIHCTSDAPFVVRRLGEARARQGAYPWRSLLDAGVHVANGTDAPVEDVDPLKCLYASVTRKREDGSEAFFPEQCMTRQEALYSYTMGNARAAFESEKKGSLTPGKLADLVILDTDLFNCPEEQLLQARVLHTIVGGQYRYSAAVSAE